MIGFTAKITKTKIFIGIAILLIPLLTFSAIYINRINKPEIVNLNGKTSAQRIAFLKQYGWEANKDNEDEKDTVIPTKFDNVYDAYNSIQLSQGFDLSAYKGEKVKLYSIKINNYPKNSEYVYATILVKGDTIIGGDIHSTELNGFMHGFKLE